MSQLTRLHELNGKLDMLQDLKISGLGLSLEQQEKLLYTHQQVLDQRFKLLKQIKKEYIIWIQHTQI
jgi:hypothetical protein